MWYMLLPIAIFVCNRCLHRAQYNLARVLASSYARMLVREWLELVLAVSTLYVQRVPLRTGINWAERAPGRLAQAVKR